MAVGKILKAMMPISTALALAAAPANAASCPPDRAIYALEFDNTRVIYTQDDAEFENNWQKQVRFEAYREGTPVWSIEGHIDCDDILGLCNLRLDAPAGEKEAPNAATETCSKFTVPVTEIHEDPDSEQVVYIAFGGLPQFSIACSKSIDTQVRDKQLFTQVENERGVVLPPYVRFSSCAR
ncbi:hypothetical protein GB928_017095 [Shinella curvata]|uniref:Uncharacterized protein n=1 Tax=Shinella curvata TaxID=1817964 RepID=A0ABT8XHV0_9HYPH|nr:hypothetical protein [Shinella curvata]MCJ8053582.1 hypothetical protein [Shinella curvata]MDO6122914.1 hypothetical protein [Shinella curvata]